MHPLRSTCAALALVACPLAAAAADAEGYLGLWQGVDSLDGSEVEVSITDVEGDGTLSTLQREGFFSICFERGEGYALGRGLVEGSGRVDEEGVLRIDEELACIDDHNIKQEPLTGPALYTLDESGKVLTISSDPPGEYPSILLHRIGG